MKIDLGSGEICLKDNQPLRLDDARGLRIECIAGTVWITEVAMPDDVFLLPGQSHRITGNGLSLIEGVGGGRIRLEAPRRRFPGLPRVPDTLPIFPRAA